MSQEDPLMEHKQRVPVLAQLVPSHSQLTDQGSQQVRAAPYWGWVQQMAQLMSPVTWKVNTSGSQSAPADLTSRQ